MGLAAGIGAAATVVGGIGSSLIQSSAAGDAAKAQEDAANKAAQTQLTMYNNTKESLAPFTNTGQSAITQLASLFGLNTNGSGGTSTGPNAQAATEALSQLPGYQFGMDQGQQALDRSAASRGQLLSGAQLEDAQKFGQGYAQQQGWQPYVTQLNSIAGLGENAGAQVGNAGTTAAANAGQYQLGAGQAQAAGIAQQGNILGQSVFGLGQQFGSSFGQLFGGGGGSNAFSGITGATASSPGFQTF